MALEASAAMGVRDLLVTVLTVAEARGNAALAGYLDMCSDVCSLALYSFAGERLLTHGWQGWLALVPVLVASNVATRFGTAWSTKHLRPLEGVS